jgi:hypothetical protein
MPWTTFMRQGTVSRRLTTLRFLASLMTTISCLRKHGINWICKPQLLILKCLLYLLCYNLQNIVIEWLTLLIRIREFPVSNLWPETGYPDWSFCGFSQYLRENLGILS